MEKQTLEDLLEANPIVAAIKDEEGLEPCLACESGMVFVLYGGMMDLPRIVGKIQGAGKLAVVHVDLIDGLSPREAAVDYIRHIRADGVISTRGNLVRYAGKRGLVAIQRFFIFDSLSMENTLKAMPLDYADAIEILPGTLPGVIRKLAALSGRPIIAGGLIFDKEDTLTALNAGAAAISTTSREVWRL